MKFLPLVLFVTSLVSAEPFVVDDNKLIASFQEGIGAIADIGSEVRVISHPDRRFFMQTSGEVSRYHQQPARKKKPATVWMSITADYAKGFSGGPVIDDGGKVVGMVSSTQSIYYDSNNGQPKGPLQMVVKNCVPAAAIRALLK